MLKLLFIKWNSSKIERRTFIQIFNKSEFKVKAMNNKIISIQSLELFPRQEHVLLISEDSLTIKHPLPLNNDKYKIFTEKNIIINNAKHCTIKDFFIFYIIVHTNWFFNKKL